MLRVVVIALTLFACAYAPGFALDFTFDHVAAVKTKVVDYSELKSPQKIWYGSVCEYKYTFTDDLDSKQRKQQMSTRIMETIGDHSIAFDRFGFIAFTYADAEYALKLSTYSSSATVVVLRIMPYTPFIKLDAPQWPLNKKMAQKGTDIPLMPLVPVLEGAAIKRLKYKNYAEQTFRAQREKFSACGNYWSIEYGLDQYTTNNSLRFRAAHNYRDMLSNAGAIIHADDGNGSVFELDLEGNHYTGKAEAYETSFKLEVIKSEVFKQTLVLSPDKLKEELDAKGKVTLEGIYFDTDKASLKPESVNAIIAAAALLRRYADLVLEVQGHTDSQGDNSYNHDLSQRRAQAVVNALVLEGADEARLHARGFGEECPVADNETAKGRAQNRRVELHRLRGGNAVRLIDIDFIKPLPRAEVVRRNHYQNSNFQLNHTPPYSKTKSHEQIENYACVVYDYEIMKNAKRDKSFGRVEILKNYKNILPMQGAQLLGEKSHQLYFTFADRGDGRRIYAIIKAYEGAYELWFYTQPQRS